MDELHRIKAPQPYFNMLKMLGKFGDQQVIAQDNSEAKIEGSKGEQSYVGLPQAAAALGASKYAASSDKESVDKWLNTCEDFLPHVYTWVAPKEGRDGCDAAKEHLQAQLQALEDALKAQSPLTGSEHSVADIALGGVLLPLWGKVLGTDEQTKLEATSSWLKGILAIEGMSEAAGDVAFCSAESGWQELDPEQEAKKRTKAVAKEAKMAKFLEKQNKSKAKLTAGAGESSKKLKAKADADAKKQAQEKERLDAISTAQSTKPGEKKDTSKPLPSSYYPAAVEAGWYAWWEQKGMFTPDPDSDKPPYVMVIPPPNVTGVLHIGHALTDAIEDTLIRWKRMCGYNALWVPGTDHAGIATQTVVEKHIAKTMGKTRHDLGREEFLKHVWVWVEKHGGGIQSQLKRMGCSVDWTRYRFTLDEKLSKAVLEAFIRLHQDGLIYRANRLVNWCCRLRTAISEIEVDYIDVPGSMQLAVPGYDDPVEFGVLTSFAYKLVDGEGEVVVATTRPETMLGDTAVAVHPDDDRYKHLHGKKVQHPFIDRQMPIITDAELVDMAFGTGCVKITPAHDPNDFEVGKRHKLEFITVLDDLGMINAEGGKFQGMPRFKARVSVVEALEEAGLYRGKADNPMRLGLCSRSKDVIEPMLKPQWWVSCGDMAAKGVQSVRSGELNIVPPLFKDVWFDWLENIRDWCISRQLWWGHRIPAYYVTIEGEDEIQSGTPGFGTEKVDRWVVARTAEEAKDLAEASFPGQTVKVVQDEDVLDTWFSSGLFPFSVLGWPDSSPSNKDLQKFYPNAILETGWDILFFWVARMVMMGQQLMGEVPFKDVFLHAMVRDAKGEKMSKSKGNVIDPLHVIEGISLENLHATLKKGNLDAKEMEKGLQGQKDNFPDGIEECGCDALRFALVQQTSQAQSINLDIKRVVGYRRFCNKLWNAVKFGLAALPSDFQPQPIAPLGNDAPLACRYILSRLNATSVAVNNALDQYRFADATSAAYSFWWDDFCDLFIELSKPYINPTKQDQELNAEEVAAYKQAAWTCLDQGLRLLHPFMPFVTEELWQRLPKLADESAESICLASFPVGNDALEDSEALSTMKVVKNISDATRQLRAAYDLLARHKPEMYVSCTDDAKASMVGKCAGELQILTGSSMVEILGSSQEAPKGCGTQVVDASTTVYLHLSGLLDPAKEIEKLGKRKEDVENKLKAQKDKMATKAYERTPEDIRSKDTAKVVEWEQEVGTVEIAIQKMKELQAAS